MTDTRQRVWCKLTPDERHPDRPLLTTERDLCYRIRTTHSQFAEDSIMERIIYRILPKHRTCFECGAGDGMLISNTLLFRRFGWAGWLVEKDQETFERLANRRMPRDTVAQGAVTRENVDDLMDEMGCPQDLDVLSLDIDGDDYGVFAALKRRPRVVCVEHLYGNQDQPAPTGEGQPQAGATAMLELFDAKGYYPLAVTPCNVIGVREDQWVS